MLSNGCIRNGIKPNSYGAFCAADAFFAPVASRFRTYGIALDAPSEAYVAALLSHPATVAFYRDAKTEPWIMDHNELDID